MEKQQFGVVGVGVMGKNLALNIERNGFSVSLYDLIPEKTEAAVRENPGKRLLATFSVEEFVHSLEKPRKILLMVKAGAPTDASIESLLPYLESGDILIDGGNTFFRDTMERTARLEKSGINFIGCGVSGGEEGALYGPALMPGGQKESYEKVAPILEKIAAKAPQDGEPCVTYIGPDGSGHFVKMVHNGIEYGDMQLIAEAFHLLRDGIGLSLEEISSVFEQWNEGELNSFLIEITADLLKKRDPDTGKAMVDIILDSAGNKGTGKWSSQNALDLGVPVPVITESVFARYISTMKEERVAASRVLVGPEKWPIEGTREEWIEKIRQALYFSKIVCYAQGFAHMRMASEKYNWNLRYGEIAKIFRAGCIIRAQFLQKITEAYDRNPDLKNLLLDEYFLEITRKYQSAIREVVSLAVRMGVPVPTFSAAVAYYDSYRSENLPANIVQAQRDYFGAHTYERKDRPGIYHFDWYGEKGEKKMEW
jgi:6-phosphogluconate dehydrogenase (decarboxylating) (EC 1.1.1.44)